MIRRFLFAIGVAALLSSCNAASKLEVDQVHMPSSVEEQLTAGEQIYSQGCATSTCHGSQGEGIRAGDSFRAWPLVGPDFQRRNPNAQVVFDVVRSGSEQSLRALTDQQIYDAIAYELSLNGIDLIEVLTSQNAASLTSGPSSPGAAWGALYPPPGNVVQWLPPPQISAAFLHAANESLALRVDQFALASTIDGVSAFEDGDFAIMIFALQNLTGDSLEVEPGFLRLFDAGGRAYDLASVRLDYPIENFHLQTIQPGYGTAAVGIFSLPAGVIPARLVYDDQREQPLILDIP